MKSLFPQKKRKKNTAALQLEVHWTYFGRPFSESLPSCVGKLEPALSFSGPPLRAASPFRWLSAWVPNPAKHRVLPFPLFFFLSLHLSFFLLSFPSLVLKPIQPLFMFTFWLLYCFLFLTSFRPVPLYSSDETCFQLALSTSRPDSSFYSHWSNDGVTWYIVNT